MKASKTVSLQGELNPVTIDDIIAIVAQYRPVSRSTVIRHIRSLNIQPVGTCRQRPQPYPAETPQMIIQRMTGRILSLRSLQSIRSRAILQRKGGKQ